MQEFLQYKIAELGSVSISVYNLFMAVILLLATWLLLFFTKRLIYRVDKFDEGKKYALYRLSKYIMLVISIVLVLKLYIFKAKIALPYYSLFRIKIFGFQF